MSYRLTPDLHKALAAIKARPPTIGAKDPLWGTVTALQRAGLVRLEWSESGERVCKVVPIEPRESLAGAPR